MRQIPWLIQRTCIAAQRFPHPLVRGRPLIARLNEAHFRPRFLAVTSSPNCLVAAFTSSPEYMLIVWLTSE